MNIEFSTKVKATQHTRNPTVLLFIWCFFPWEITEVFVAIMRWQPVKFIWLNPQMNWVWHIQTGLVSHPDIPRNSQWAKNRPFFLYLEVFFMSFLKVIFTLHSSCAFETPRQKDFKTWYHPSIYLDRIHLFSRCSCHNCSLFQ